MIFTLLFLILLCVRASIGPPKPSRPVRPPVRKVPVRSCPIAVPLPPRPPHFNDKFVAPTCYRMKGN